MTSCRCSSAGRWPEYERTLIAERMRRGRLAKLRAGALLPWTRPPFDYRVDPERPPGCGRGPVEPGEAVLVAQLFDWYLEPRHRAKTPAALLSHAHR